MSRRINVIYKNGVFHPLKPLDLKDGSIFEITIIKELGNASDLIKDAQNNISKLDVEEILTLKRIIDNLNFLK